MPDQTAPAQLIAAIRLLVADFDGRATTRVITGGRAFEFFPTAITDNIPPLEPRLSHAVCLLSRFHLEHVVEATLGVGEEDRGAMIISDLLLSHNLPRTLARWTPTGAPGEIRVPLANEYVPEGSVDIYLNGVTASDRIILVDDLISTGERWSRWFERSGKLGPKFSRSSPSARNARTEAENICFGRLDSP